MIINFFCAWKRAILTRISLNLKRTRYEQSVKRTVLSTAFEVGRYVTKELHSTFRPARCLKPSRATSFYSLADVDSTVNSNKVFEMAGLNVIFLEFFQTYIWKQCIFNQVLSMDSLCTHFYGHFSSGCYVTDTVDFAKSRRWFAFIACLGKPVAEENIF